MKRLALVMVTREPGDIVERALRSAQPFVDELVVLDLGSGESDLSRVARCGARIVPGRWSDDASAGRNAALDAADADWNLVLDAEEWIALGAERLRDIAATRPDRVGLVEVVRAPGASAEHDHPRHLAARLLPRGVRYAGAFREEPVFDLPTFTAGVRICSDDTETGRWRTHSGRNEAILLQTLAVRPQDPRVHIQLGQELRAAGRFDEACDHFLTALEQIPAEPTRHAVVIATLETLTRAERFGDAVALMDTHSTHWLHSPDFTFLLGDLFFEMMLADPSTAGELAPLAETSWRRCIELGERPDLVGAVHGRGSFLAAQNLYVLALTLGRQEAANDWWARAEELRMTSRSRPGLLG